MTDIAETAIIETWWLDVSDTLMPTIEEILAHWGAECWVCHKPLNPMTATRDHLLPQVRGGSNAMANMAPACAACNHRKGNRTPLEFLGDACPELLRDVTANTYRRIPDYAPAADVAQMLATDFGVHLPADAAMAIAEAVSLHLTLHPPTSSSSRLSSMLRSTRNRVDRQGRKIAALKAELAALEESA